MLRHHGAARNAETATPESRENELPVQVGIKIQSNITSDMSGAESRRGKEWREWDEAQKRHIFSLFAIISERFRKAVSKS